MAHDPSLAEFLRRMQGALDTMDPLPLAVFERLRFRDMDYFQIATELGITVGEVERHVAAAMRHIMRCTGEDGGP